MKIVGFEREEPYNAIPKVCIPEDKEKIKKHIQALEYQLIIDKSDLDKEIHTQALNDLKTALNKK